ncbi:MAG: hypothetical protein U0V75_15710 [Ferruginibacter sp.]|mgnify:CR=1 FL=1
MIFLDAVPESFGKVISAAYIIIPVVLLGILVFKIMKQRKKNRHE